MRTAKCYTAASCQSRPLTYASPGTSRPGAERTLHSCVVTAVLTENSSAPGAHSVLPVHLPNSAGLQPPCVGPVSLLNVRSTNLTFSKSHQPLFLCCVGEEKQRDKTQCYHLPPPPHITGVMKDDHLWESFSTFWMALHSNNGRNLCSFIAHLNF